MSFQITEAFVLAFREGITIRAAQRESRLRSTVEVETGVRGKSGSRDFIGPRRPSKRVTRHGDTDYVDTVHDRRWWDLSVYDDADLIDEPDKVRMLSDPTNPYSAAMAQGFGRHQDEIILDGAVGVTFTGEERTTSSAAPTNVLTEAGVLGQTLAKMIAVKRLFDAREQPMERTWVQTARQFEDMFNINEIRSSDFNVTRVLAGGDLNNYMGYNWKRCEDPIVKLRAGTTNKRRTVVYCREAVLFVVGSDVQASIDRLPGKKNSTQVFYSADYGACRLDDAGVIVQECHEA